MRDLRIVPVTLAEANAFVWRLHRHRKEKLPGHSFAVGVADAAGTLRGVAIVGNPSAPALQDGILAEIRRVCTDGARNACSMLYGASRRAARVAVGVSGCTMAAMARVMSLTFVVFMAVPVIAPSTAP